MKLPGNVGPIHFIGIGGIGMSGIAEILHNLGYKVSGSDQSDSVTLQRLKSLGITTFVGHDAKHIGRADAVVTAIVDLAHAHGMLVTAEGVETPRQARRLREIGCDQAQGYHFGRPADAARIIAG